MIRVENLSFARGKENLIEKGNLSIYPNQKVGLIGSNGSGKSTFFDVLLGKVDILQGDCSIPKSWTLAHVSQLIPNSEQSALDFVMNGDKHYRALEAELENALTQNNHHKISAIHQELENIDAYRIPSKAGELLYGLGFSTEDQLKAVNSFSGGWRVRLNLAQALLCRSDCLLLDEPTNHLDMSAILWLENWLKNYQGTVIVIAHDSAFLDNVIDSIVVIENQNFTSYKGNYSQYLNQRASQLALQQKNRDKQLKAQAHLQKFIDKFKAKASKAKQAQSRMKQLARMEVIQAVHCQSPFEFHFKELEKCSNPLLSLDRVDVGYSEGNPVIKNVSLRLSPSDRIGILGENGAGKSTLIKLLAGEIPPLGGSLNLSPKLKIGYFSQHQVEQLNLKTTPFEHLLEIAPKTSEQSIRDYFGGFGFSGDKVYQQVGSFSGGEKARLTLALIVWQNPHLLLLDEPTNHLDIEMREALSLALQEFEGALVVISHDRQLIAETTEMLYLINEGRMQDFEGDMTEYCQWLANKKKAVTAKNKKTPKPKNVPNPNLAKNLQKLEAEIDKVSNEINELEEKLADNTLYTVENSEKLSKLQEAFDKAKVKLLAKEEAWLEMSSLEAQNTK